jgi:hypothetical protein
LTVDHATSTQKADEIAGGDHPRVDFLVDPRLQEYGHLAVTFMALALTTRRSSIAAIASALAAIAVAAAVAGRSCRVSQPGPEAAVRDMLQAAKTGDLDTVVDMLTPAARARLEAEARRAADLVGASIRYTAKDLVSIGSSDSIAAPTDITILEERGARAVVEVVSPAGRARMQLEKIEGRWKIEIPQYGRPSDARP